MQKLDPNGEDDLGSLLKRRLTEVAFSDSTPERSCENIFEKKFYSPSTWKEEQYIRYLFNKLRAFAELRRLQRQRGDLLVGDVKVELKIWHREGDTATFEIRNRGQMVTSPNEGDSSSCPLYNSISNTVLTLLLLQSQHLVSDTPTRSICG